MPRPVQNLGTATNFRESKAQRQQPRPACRPTTASVGSLHKSHKSGDSHQFPAPLTTRIPAAGTLTYFQRQDFDARGNVTASVLGNGVTTTRTFEASSGHVTAISSVKGASTVQNLTYAFDVHAARDPTRTARRSERQAEAATSCLLGLLIHGLDARCRAIRARPVPSIRAAQKLRPAARRLRVHSTAASFTQQSSAARQSRHHPLRP